MSVTLEVRDSDKLYHPGDRVVGIVRLRPLGEGETVAVSQVRVELAGRCQTRVDEHGSHMDSLDKNAVSLFRLEKVLLNGPYTVASVQEWPFGFSFPSDCRQALLPAFELKKREQQHFNRDKSQPLPPSMRLTSDLGAEDTKSATVEYFVRGVLDLQGSLHRQREARCPLRLWPYGSRTEGGERLEHSMYALNMKIESPHLDPAVGDRKLSTREKLKAKMSSHVPSVSFRLMVAMPKTCTIADPVPIHLSLRPASDDDKTELAPVILREFFIKAIQHVNIATNSSGGTFEETLPTETITHDCSIGSWTGNKPIEGQLDLSTLYEKKRFDWFNITPSFRTFNIGQHWTLWLTATVEVARKTDTVHVKHRSFTLLSPFNPPPSIEEASTTDEAAVMARSRDLPSYEEAAKQ